MKLLLLVFLFGFAAAYTHEAIERARDEAFESFVVGMENAPSLREALGMPYAEELDEIDDDVKTELGKHLKETLDHLLEKMKDAIEHGKTLREDLVEKVKQLKKKLHELGFDIGNKAKEMMEKIKEKAKNWLKELLEKLGGSKDEEFSEVSRNERLSLKEKLEKLREKIEDAMDKSKIIEIIKEVFGKTSAFGNMLVEKVKAATDDVIGKIKKIIHSLLGNTLKRSVEDLYNKIKEYLKGLHVDAKEKFSNFLDWVKKVYESGADAAKDRIAYIRKVVRELIAHVKEAGKKTTDEALEFFRPYKHDLGHLWEELKEAVKKAYH